MKLDLLTNATVIDDAIRFVSQKSHEKSANNINEGDKEQSNKPDYEDQLEEEQEGHTGEITATTTN
jgi:hypothetical protein